MIRYLFKLLLSFFALFVHAADYLDPNEQAYLKQKSTVTIAVLKEVWMPYWGGTGQEPIGIEHDFASGIAKELGINIEYKGFDTIEALLNAVSTGKADMAIGFGQTLAREEKFLFSKPLYENVRVIWLRDKKMKDKHFHSLKWVCIKSTSYCEILKERGYPNIIMAIDENTAMEMVRQRVADATITNYVSLNYTLSQKSLHLGAVVFDKDLGVQINRVLINNNESLLHSAINKVLSADKKGLTDNRIKSNDIYFLNDQFNLLLLNELDRDKVIRYSIQDDLFPLSFWDEDDNKYKGYIHDLLERISARSLLKFEFIPANGHDVEDMLREGKVDLLPSYNLNNVEKDGFISIGKYSEIQFGYLESKQPYHQKVVGILDRTGKFQAYVESKNKLGKTIFYHSFFDIEEAFKTGKISHALVNKSLIKQLTIWGGSDYVISNEALNDFDIELTMVMRDEDYALQQVLKKVMAIFSEKEIKEIEGYYERVSVSFGYNKQRFLIFILFFFCVSLLFFIIVLFLFFYFKDRLKKSEKTTKLSEHQSLWLTKLLDAIPSMIFISDENGDVVLTNAAYRKIYHTCCEKGCVQPQPECSFLALPEQYEAEYSIIIQAHKSNCSIGEHYFHVTRHAISHPINQRKYYLTLFNDITELKETEQALRQSNEQALQAVEARNHFLAVVSHELRTPIAAMLGLMEILASRLKSSESQLLLTNAISSAERLKLHVNDILDFSKIEAQQLQLDVGLHNLADELGPLLRGFEASAQLKEIEFDVIWSPNSLLLAHVDALRFNQVVTNLLSNAIKFTDQGRVVFKIDVAPEMLTIVVEDTGCGMTQTQIDSLFVPFVQADSTITRRFGGTGLGMSIVANLIELMNGTIEVKSEFDQGTQIRVSLPLLTQTCDEFQGRVVAMSYHSPYMLWAKALGMRMEEDEEWVGQSGRNIYPDLLLNKLRDTSNITHTQAEPAHSHLLQGHVLVADDDAINRLLIKKQLNQLGLSATLVSDGLQAFEKLSQHPEQYDLLITDCHMPHLDGFALTRKVKQEISLFKGAVVGCTAEDSRLAAEQALQAGMDKVIYKPYTLANLRKVLSRYLTTQWAALPKPSWLDAYQEEEREEMALVVAESLAQDIALLNQPDCDVKALAHRIKGAAGSLQLQRLADLAKTVEKQNDPQQLVADKQQLINAMHEVVEQAKQWLHQHQSE